MKHKEISTLTCSYDTYHFLWQDYDKLFRKYWKLNTHNIAVGETISYNSDQFNFLTPGMMRSETGKDLWGKRMLHALEHVTTPYVFVLLIDYYFIHDLTKEFIEQQVEFLNLNKANKVIIDENSPRAYTFCDSVHPYYKFDNYSDYQTSLMPAIWKTDWLRSVINENDDPWIFETDGTDKIKGQDNHVYLHMCEAPIYYNVIRKRKYIPETWGPIKWEEFKEREQLNDPSIHLTDDITNWK
jgi:hypothetical protein